MTRYAKNLTSRDAVWTEALTQALFKRNLERGDYDQEIIDIGLEEREAMSTRGAYADLQECLEQGRSIGTLSTEILEQARTAPFIDFGMVALINDILINRRNIKRHEDNKKYGKSPLEDFQSVLKSFGELEETGEVVESIIEILKKRMHESPLIPKGRFCVIPHTPNFDNFWKELFLEGKTDKILRDKQMYFDRDIATPIYKRPCFTLREYEEQRNPLINYYVI